MNEEQNPVCEKCDGAGEKVVQNKKFSDVYAIVFCDCEKGRRMAANQSEILSEHLS